MSDDRILIKWLIAVPSNVYAPCPCGCGVKWRFVVKGGEDVVAQHYEWFKEKCNE
jgi:hypothetical protein